MVRIILIISPSLPYPFFFHPNHIGPLALVDNTMPVVYFATKDKLYDKVKVSLSFLFSSSFSYPFPFLSFLERI